MRLSAARPEHTRHFNFYWSLIIPIVLLVSLGLVTLLSIERSSFFDQLLFTGVGLVAFVIFSKIDFSLYRYLDKFIYVACIIFLLLSYLGPNIRGATRWVSLGPIQLQPSELVKPFFLLAIVSLMTRYPPVKIKYILLQLILFLIPFLLVLKQPDLGSSLIYVAIWLTTIVVSGIPLRYIFGAFTAFLIAIPTGYEFLHEYQKDRIVTFLNPLHDPAGAGYNAIQSMIAVGSGRLFGRGFGRGTQSMLSFLPERHTDFIFASFVEEFGLIGALVVLIIFFYLLWKLLKLAEAQDDGSVEHLFVIGAAMMVFAHVLINVGMNIGLLPITGITLPFVSAGGSSLLAMFITIGLTTSAIQHSRSN